MGTDLSPLDTNSDWVSAMILKAFASFGRLQFCRVILAAQNDEVIVHNVKTFDAVAFA